MNKILRYSFVALLAMVVGNVAAQEVTLDFTLETAEGSKESVWGFPASSKNKQVDEQSFTYDGYTVKVAGSTGEGYYWHDTAHYLLFGKKGAYLTLPAFSFDVERIDIEGNSGASAGTKQNIFVGDEAVSTETTGAQGTNFFNIAEGKQAAGTIYTIKVTSAHNNQIKTIKIWKKGSGTKQAADIKWSSSSATVTIGADDNVFPTLDNPNNLSVTYESSKPEIATVDANGSVNLVAAGSAKISAIFEGNDSYEASTVSYNLTVKEATTPEPPAQEITVARALEIAGALENKAVTTEEYIIKGYIVSDPEWKPYYNEKDKPESGIKYYNLQFILADAADATTGLTIYNPWNTENKSFLEIESSIVKGAYVSLQGKLTNYNETLELTKGHFLSYNATNISNINVDQQNNAPAYNVGGQRVNQGYKGLVIKGGKKLIQK